jgi:hypothetical protein
MASWPSNGMNPLGVAVVPPVADEGDVALVLGPDVASTQPAPRDGRVATLMLNPGVVPELRVVAVSGVDPVGAEERLVQDAHPALQPPPPVQVVAVDGHGVLAGDELQLALHPGVDLLGEAFGGGPQDVVVVAVPDLADRLLPQVLVLLLELHDVVAERQ